MNGTLLLSMLALVFTGCVRQPANDIATIPPRGQAQTPAAPADPIPATVTATAPATSLLPPPEAMTDTVITARVQAGLLTDPGMNGADVSVNTAHGVVVLTGLVTSQEQAAIASSHAQREDGVMRVDNHLAVNLR